MLKKNNSKKPELPEEPALTDDSDAEDEAMLENEFDGTMDTLELEDDEFDDWSPELEKIQRLSKTPVAPKPATPFFTPLDKKSLDEVTVPTKFICPLSKQMMMDPVRIAGSKVPIAYEKTAIEAHYEETGTDPMTHDCLGDDAHFMPDLALKREISDFCVTNHLCTANPEEAAPQKHPK